MNAIRIDGRNLDFRNVTGFNKPQSEGFIFTSAAEARHNAKRWGWKLADAKHCYHAFSRFWIVAAMEGDVYRLLSATGKTITIPYERPK